MRARITISVLSLLTMLGAVIGSLALQAPAASAFEQGTITVTKMWASGQEPAEVVEVCFVVTADPDGTEILGEACTSDDTYTVSFGPSDPPLATGVQYYVWEDVGGGWMVTDGNPVEVSIPDTSGEIAVSFENQRAEGTSTIILHKATCPETTADLFGQCHDDRVPDVRFTISGARVTTDSDGVATADVASGTVRITEAAVDFSESSTAGAAYVYCSLQPGDANVLYDDLADHRRVELDVPAGATVICDWYDLTTAAGQPAKLELHKRVCPTSNPSDDLFEECHDFPPQQPVSFSIDGEPARFVDESGNVTFSGLSAGTHALSEIEGPPLAYVDLRIWCSVQGSDQPAFHAITDGPNFEVPVGSGEYVICDVFNVPLDLSGRTPTAVAPTQTPVPIVPATMTATATATLTPLPPTATQAPVVGRPIHIHAGTCERLTNDPRYNLTDLTTPESTREGADAATVAETSYTVVNVSLDDLLATDFAINAHPSHEKMRPFVACGEIGGPRTADGSVIVGLREQNGSGLTGIAFLAPDPANPSRTRVSVFLAQGLAEEDPTLLPPIGDAIVIHSIVNNGPISPEFQAGYEITIDATGTAEIIITPPGASDALSDDDRTAEPETRTVHLTTDELLELLDDLNRLGYFGLIQADQVNPDALLVGGSTNILTVTVIDGTWTVDQNGLSTDQREILDNAQQLIGDAVGGVQLPDAP